MFLCVQKQTIDNKSINIFFEKLQYLNGLTSNLYLLDANRRLLMLVKGFTGPRSTVGNVSGYRCVSDCRSRGREFDPGPVPYFCGD